MTPKTLRVRARDGVLVQDHERLDAGVNAFVGHKFGPNPEAAGQFAFVPTGEDVELPYRAEYVHAIAAGDLIAIDADTAKVAGLSLAPRPRTSNPPPNALRDLKEIV
jgi:hypothetical protein